MRRAIALFIVISFIIIALFLINQILKSYKLPNNPLTQTTVDIISIKNVFKNLDLNYSMIYNTFHISSKDGNFRKVIKIKKILDKVNLNELNNTYVQTYIDNILQQYQINDPVFFKDILFDTYDKDDKEREAYSEIKLYNKKFIDGGFYNFRQFNMILKWYAQKREDKNIFKIPWKKLVYFSKKKHIIDCNIINENTAKFLGLVWDDTMPLNCKNLKNFKENRKIMQSLDIISPEKNASYPVDVVIDKLNIVYDLGKKKILKIEGN